MIREMDERQIDRLLRSQIVGRIGCHAGGRTYVVPVAYAYDGVSILGHTADGLKLRMMRQNRHVCFQLDRVASLSDWESVILWGTFEELTGEAARVAMHTLVARLEPQRGSPTSEAGVETLAALAGSAGVAFRIRIAERTGRYERIRNEE
jgi:nitroimidazol reductase NimA-like FMN-containing flavoprotein (pyridoxamine 5'-phosphate oxidase superfamily)